VQTMTYVKQCEMKVNKWEESIMQELCLVCVLSAPLADSDLMLLCEEGMVKKLSQRRWR
jgi:hypothetical protein